jgi:phosphonate transport system substrate-binding protein
VKTMLRFVLLCSLLFSSIASAVTIGFLPGGDQETMKKGAVLIAQALQDQLNVPVTVYFSKDYGGLIEAMKNKKVDFAFFTAATYIMAEKAAGAKVLLKKVWDLPFYHSALLTLKKSHISKVKDLKGKTLAFVDKKSTSGALYPQLMFKKAKFDLNSLKEIKYTGSHLQSVEALESGKVDAIAVFADDKKGLKNAFVKYAKIENPASKIKILWVSDPIPNDPFCVRQDFYDKDPKLVHRLMFALIDVVDQLKDKKEIKEVVGASGLVPATQKQYDAVRELVQELEIKL